ncbi:hypothetical protein [Bacillus thuringiensis]|uniref:hypothetical protein n=1 Tax=Bacillus thuringiensis TaxID=1428 RepID=UPI0026E1FEE1|nr:hypothetical protein [Bacillus thuringiensis]MDO6630088.1 hypothetical protein [Bacillus thuringiensis]MDO6700113.1 hypothetical protein [Bacillus thuringiensis]
MSEIIYKPIMESEVKVSETYSICIDKCMKFENGIEKGEQVVMRYKKNGTRVPRQPAFNELNITEAIINAYKNGIFSRKALELLKKGINEIE